MPYLIGCGYRKRSGKDTVADFLVRNHGFVKLSWADPLKEGVKDFHGWTDEHVHGDLKETVDPYWGYSPRFALQHIGTNLVRGWIPDFWVKATQKAALEHLTQGQSVVIADVRFKNEARAIQEMGGEVWKIHRPSLPAPNIRPTGMKGLLDSPIRRVKKAVGVEVAPYDHPSEVDLADFEDWNQTLPNVATLKYLYSQVNSALERAVEV